jgi:hypothetical protein
LQHYQSRMLIELAGKHQMRQLLGRIRSVLGDIADDHPFKPQIGKHGADHFDPAASPEVKGGVVKSDQVGETPTRHGFF